MQLGKLERVEVRTVWQNEAYDFTPWLANNLELLGESLHMRLSLAGCEHFIGKYKADIVARNTDTDDTVIIENQLERTDHSHLGQLVTYASNTDAAVLIWVAERFEPEHLQAVHWLNDLNDRVSVFAVELELWKIGGSPIAPTFKVASRPNTILVTPSVQRTHKVQILRIPVQINDETLLSCYPKLQEWIDQGVRTATVEEINRITGYSKQKIRAIKLEKDRRNSNLIRVSSVIEWLRTMPLPEVVEQLVELEA